MNANGALRADVLDAGRRGRDHGSERESDGEDYGVVEHALAQELRHDGAGLDARTAGQLPWDCTVDSKRDNGRVIEEREPG
jgi:hypothetical protein